MENETMYTGFQVLEAGYQVARVVARAVEYCERTPDLILRLAKDDPTTLVVGLVVERGEYDDLTSGLARSRVHFEADSEAAEDGTYVVRVPVRVYPRPTV